jgi:Domain of unknown function (DUF1707)
MPGPRDQETAGAAAGRGRMRASRADREQTIQVLKIAFVQGRLDKGELDTRVSRAFSARTYADLATLTADIPAAPAAASTPRRPAPARARKRTSQKAVVWGLVAGPMACLLVVLVVFGPKLMAGAGILFALSAAMLGGLLVLYSWLDKRAKGQRLPPGPFQDGIGLQRQCPTAMSADQARPGVHPGRPDADFRAQRSRQRRPDPSRRGIQVPARARPAPGPA